MKLLDRLLKRGAAAAEPQSPAMPQASTLPLSSGYAGSELYEWLVGGLSAAGVAVTERTVMQVSAVYACVNLIGGAIGSMPLPIYKRTVDGRERVMHDVWWLLNEQPWPTMSAAVFWETLTASLLLQGDAFSRIHRASEYSPKIIGFEPLHPSRVEPRREGNRLLYIIRSEDGTKAVTVDQDDMLHIPGPGFDGLRGQSQIKHALRPAAGIALAADEYSSRFFSNGARPDFAIEFPGNLTPDQQDMIRRTWAERHSGVGKSHLPALLAGGAKIHEITLNAEDAQLISTRRFQVEDVARIFGVPPFMIGHTETTTSWGSGVEQMGIGFVKYTLQRHLTKIEQEVNRKTFRTSTYFCEFNTAGLERGDYKSRSEGYRVALGRAGEPGWMTINEVRRIENLPPIDGGDTINTGSKADETATQTAGG